MAKAEGWMGVGSGGERLVQQAQGMADEQGHGAGLAQWSQDRTGQGTLLSPSADIRWPHVEPSAGCWLIQGLGTTHCLPPYSHSCPGNSQWPGQG